MKFHAALLCIVFVFHGINGLLNSQTTVMKTESDLRLDLFSRYDKLVRPIRNPMSAVPAWVVLSLLRISDLDEEKGVLAMDTFFSVEWVDDFLQWDPERYGGIQTLNLPSDEVWKPDFSLYTAIPDTSYVPRTLTQVVINHTGVVLWVRPFTLNSQCQIEISPKKIQMCKIKIGSWTYSGKQLDIKTFSEDADLSNFQDTNPDWQMVTATSGRQDVHYPCCPDDYPQIYFNVTLKRHPSSSFTPHKLKPEISTFLAFLKSQSSSGNEARDP